MRLPFLASLILAMASAAPADAARLTLTWTINSHNEAAFGIERREPTGSFAEIATIAAARNSYTDATLTAGRTYCYRVRAVNAAGYSPYTNEACGVSVDSGGDPVPFITRFYSGALGRAPDQPGLQAWTAFLGANCTPAGFQQLAGMFFDSHEFRTSRPLALPELIRTLYVTYLGREPDPAGLATWSNVMRQVRLMIAVNGFVPSTEFQRLLPDAANRTAVTALVTRLYTQGLGRAADQAGLNTWVDRVVATGRLDELAAGFLASPEFERRPQTFRDYVTTLYRTLLGRNPDAGGLDAWEAILRTTLLQIINAGFVPSSEFQGLAASICS